MNIKNNCKKATLLVEKKLLVSITMLENIELKIHLAGCPDCRLYLKQSKLLTQMLYNYFHFSPDTAPQLNESIKQQMQNRIDEEYDKKGE